MRLRARKLRAGESLSCPIVVKPSFARLEARDDRVPRRRVVFRCMLTGRSIAAADVTALDASAKMKPPPASGRAFHATRSTRLGCEVDAIALRRHRSIHWKCVPSLQMLHAAIRHDRILPVFCPTGQLDRGRACRRDASRKSLLDQRALYCAWGCFPSFVLSLD